MKIVITGGHLTPALAVMTKLKQESWQVFFIGREFALEGETTPSVEFKTVQALGIPFLPITTGRLQRSLTRYTIPSLFKIPIGFVQSFYYLVKFKPDLILSFGGYLALPVVLAGWLLRIPVVTHEQSVVPGLATKIIGLLAKRIGVSWPQTLDHFSKEKVVLTGNPIREEVFKMNNVSSIKYQVSSEDLPLIYITGGSLGAHSINEVVAQILPWLLKKYRIIHQCGDSRNYRDYEKLSTIVNQLSLEQKRRYFLTKYVEAKAIGGVLNQADLVISRSGANIVAELAALGKPAILIPLPWAGQDEQRENARLLEEKGSAVVLPQTELTAENLYQCTSTMIQKIADFKKKAMAAQKLVDLRAADKLLKVIKEVVRKKA